MTLVRPVIPRLRKAGYYVEKGRRPNSRGMRYRVYQPPDKTIAIVYSRRHLLLWMEHLCEGGPQPPAEVI